MITNTNIIEIPILICTLDQGGNLDNNEEILKRVKVCGGLVAEYYMSSRQLWEIYDKHLEHLCHDSPSSS